MRPAATRWRWVLLPFVLIDLAEHPASTTCETDVIGDMNSVSKRSTSAEVEGATSSTPPPSAAPQVENVVVEGAMYPSMPPFTTPTMMKDVVEGASTPTPLPAAAP